MNRLPSLQTDKQQSILITGGMGFIGSHLAEEFLEKGCSVTLLDNLSTGRFDNVQHLANDSRVRFVVESLDNAMVLDQLASECDMIVHLAAAVGVKLIVENPKQTIETNIQGTEAVLKAAARYGVKVMIASTSEVYGKSNKIPFCEDDDVVLGATRHSRWAYATSKMVDEFLELAYWKQMGLPVVLFRLFNTVGPRQTGQYGMVVPRFVQAALRGDQLTVYGDGQQSRCFLHVRDAVHAIVRLSETEEALGNVFNIGSREEVTILELARRTLRHATASKQEDEIDKRITFVPYAEAYADGFEDMRRRVPDTTKIQRTTGWAPQRTLDDILRDVIAHFVR